ncbi:sigma-70 family RNA polymerase sigma factor [Arhodomonas sp. SL1]|uniref:sigma-70 family RNA polymerase sigma factor n=1 Tax=Arhodomonas sp. SL1 TaxID=3425691 RepID=UPI003F884436
MAERLQIQRNDPEEDPVEAPSYGCVLGAWHDHERELRGFLINRLGDHDAAEDLLQEVFLRAMHEGEGFCRLERPRAWLFRVARNAAVDRERRGRPFEPVPEDLADEDPDTPPVDTLSACLERNLADLPETDREIIRHCDLAGTPQRIYAAERGLTVGAVKTRLFRARQRLRKRLIRHCRVRFDEQGRVCCHLPPEND